MARTDSHFAHVLPLALELVPRHGARHCRGQALWHRCAHRYLQHDVVFRHHFGTDRHGAHRFPAADSAVDPRNGRKLRFRGALRRVEKSTPAVALPQYLQRAGDSFQRRRADLPKSGCGFGEHTRTFARRDFQLARKLRNTVSPLAPMQCMLDQLPPKV